MTDRAPPPCEETPVTTPPTLFGPSSADVPPPVPLPPPTPTTGNEPANHLYEGDCLAVLPTLPANSVDFVLCDLPYGTTRNKWDSVIDLPSLWREYRRVLKPRGAVALTGQGLFTARLILSNESWFRYKIVWVKSKPTNFLNVRVQPLRKHEDICIFYGAPPAYHPQMTPGIPYDKGVRKDQSSGSYGDFRPVRVRSGGARYPSDVVYFQTAESEPERTVWHPTQKPVALARYLIRTYSNPGDLVLDNAFGSGSFLVAAHLEARRFCGIERNRAVRRFKRQEVDYLEVARARLEAFGAAPGIVRAPGPWPADPGSRRPPAESSPARRRPRPVAPSGPGGAPARGRSRPPRRRLCSRSRSAGPGTVPPRSRPPLLREERAPLFPRGASPGSAGIDPFPGALDTAGTVAALRSARGTRPPEPERN